MTKDEIAALRLLAIQSEQNADAMDRRERYGDMLAGMEPPDIFGAVDQAEDLEAYEGRTFRDAAGMERTGDAST